MKTVTSFLPKESWCAALPVRKTQNEVHCQIERNRLQCTAATGSKNHPAAAHQSPANVDQLNITEVHISMRKKKLLANPFERSEPTEPLL